MSSKPNGAAAGGGVAGRASLSLLADSPPSIGTRTRTRGSASSTVRIESLLWLGVALVPCCQARDRSEFVTSLWVVLQVVWHLDKHHPTRRHPHPHEPAAQPASVLRRRPQQQRQQKQPPRRRRRVVRWKTTANHDDNDNNNDDGDGQCLAIVLPHTLWQGLPVPGYARYTLVGTLLGSLSSSCSSWKDSYNNNRKSNNCNSTLRLLHTFGTMVLLLALLLHSDDVYNSTQALPFGLLWWILYELGAQHRRVLQAVTRGEWWVVTNLLAVALTEWLRRQQQCCGWLEQPQQQQQPEMPEMPRISTQSSFWFHRQPPEPEPPALRSNNIPESHLYASVAVAGLVGCALACISVEYLGAFLNYITTTAVRFRNPTKSWFHNDNDNNYRSVILRCIFMVVIALGTVEIGTFGGGWCWCHELDYYHYTFPQSLHWMFTDFLWTVESSPFVTTAFVDRVAPLGSSNNNSTTPGFWLLRKITNVPRVAWLVYWIVILAVTLPLAPKTTITTTTTVASSHDNDKHHHHHHNNNNAILARKWFHGVAVLLFAPVTVLAPQLMSLAYAVALGGLLLLESLRRHVPWLDHFYGRYLDVRNKQERHDQVIVSHMALIAGCALPLWISQWRMTLMTAQNHSATTTTIHFSQQQRLFLSLWGVWVTGIGDAMGAVMGVTWGRRYWGRQRRTVEGSLAMLVSLILVCALTTTMAAAMANDDNDDDTASTMDWRRWLPVCVVATLMEAFTLQIDNMVLPLVGVALLLFL